jgi:5-methylcytosine-specific restriction enzyme subunit McrC
LSDSEEPIEVEEYETKEISSHLPFTLEEEKILEDDFNDKICLTYKSGNRCFIESQQYVGFIILPGHKISIRPKIKGINFINMVRYALNLPELNIAEINLKEIHNYFHILVLFILQEIDMLFQKGLNSGYTQSDDNLTTVKGKILFKEHINSNYHRPDRIYCSFSELSVDILENRIIKYCLYFLCQCYFNDKFIDSKLLSYYKKLDYVSLTPISLDNFKSIQYTPLNTHYKNILTLCEIVLKDSSIDAENIGERTVKSFLINMNELFEKFVINVLKSNEDKYQIKPQEEVFVDIDEKLIKRRPDIVIYDQIGTPLLILDTKYKKLDKLPDEKDFDQVTGYSTFMGVKNVGLVYAYNKSAYLQHNMPIKLKHDINLHLLLFDLSTENLIDFEERCLSFINSLYLILERITKMNK